MAAVFPYPCLLADVGGTNARFVMAEKPGHALSPLVRLPTSLHHDFADTVSQALLLGGYAKPRSFLLAAAGAIEGKQLTFSNASSISGMLTVDGSDLMQKLGLDQGILLNDFEALSLSLPFLPQQGLLSLGSGEAVETLPRIVVGAGTGLGVGALLNLNGRYMPIASEGGHIALAPENEGEERLWALLGSGRINGDALLSGKGLGILYTALAKQAGMPIQDATPAAIAKRALDGSELLARETVGRFLGFLGRFAGDMAMTFGAKGGVFIGGGIAPRFSNIAKDSPFRAEFDAKQKHKAYMEKIPVWLIMQDDPAITGLANLAATPDLFELDFGRRCWG